MKKSYEIVRHQGDATVYRLKGGRAEVAIYNKAAATPTEVLEQCEAAERELGHQLDANDDPKGTGRPNALGTLEIGEWPDGIIVSRKRPSSGYVQLLILDHELPDLMAVADKRWRVSFEKQKTYLLAEIRRKGEELAAAQDRLRELKEGDRGARS